MSSFLPEQWREIEERVREIIAEEATSALAAKRVRTAASRKARQ